MRLIDDLLTRECDTDIDRRHSESIPDGFVRVSVEVLPNGVSAVYNCLRTANSRRVSACNSERWHDRSALIGKHSESKGSCSLIGKLISSILRITRIASFGVLAVILSGGLATYPVRSAHAATSQAGGATLQLLQTASGNISDVTPEQRWAFNATSGQRLSVRMQATSGDLQPAIQLLDASGNLLATGTITSFRNATIDAFVIPKTATYTVSATRLAGTSSGAYNVTVLPGFSFLLLNNPTSANTPLHLWSDSNAVAHYADGKLELQLVAENAMTYSATLDRFGTYKDLYIQTAVHSKQPNTYWQAGLLFRSASRDGSVQFYVYFINSDGKWKLAISQPAGLKSIQDWTALPDKPQSDATIGILVKGNAITPFYNGQPIADLTDDTFSDGGGFGVAVGTSTAPNDNTQVQFDNFVVTIPADSSVNAPIQVPDKLVNWQRAEDAILAELQQDHLVPNGGKLGLELKDKAFATNNGALSIQYQPLAESMSFTDLVYSADVTWESSNDNVGCALELRAADDNNFTIVYVDRKGGFGVRQVSAKDSKDNPPPMYYNLSDAIIKTNKATNRVTAIAIGNSLILYINGTLAISMNVRQAAGGLRIAAYNYQQASSICQFTNLWLRSYDS